MNNRTKKITVNLDGKQTVKVLASGLADDFNNILTVILGACSLIDSECISHSDLLQCINLIRTSAEHAALLSNQLRQACLLEDKC